MGKQSRRKRERRETESPELKTFRAAMLGEHIRDLASRDVGCIVCGRAKPENLGIWEVNDAFGRKIGVPPGKRRLYFYRLCADCQARAHGGDRWTRDFIEAAIIARERGEPMVALGGDGMPIIDDDPGPLPLGPTF